MGKYNKQTPEHAEVGLINIACCDCGLVHKMGFTVEDDNKVRFGYERDDRATAQLRRGVFASLKDPENGSKWKLVRI